MSNNNSTAEIIGVINDMTLPDGTTKVGMFEAPEQTVAEAKSSYGNGTAKTVTFKYYGKYEDLKNKVPGYGAGWEQGYKVQSAQLTRQEGGGMAELTVVCGEMPPSSSSTSTTAYGTTYDVTCAEVNQPLAFNKNFPSKNISEWSLFLASPAKIQAQKKYLVDPDDPNSEQKTLASDLQAWAELYNKGISTYIAYQPVVTKTETTEGGGTPPTPGGVGTKDTPPSPYDSLAKEWLKTGDSVNVVKSRDNSGNIVESYQRTQQWTGAEEWPDLIYGEGA